jgi:hypothetical protein
LWRGKQNRFWQVPLFTLLLSVLDFLFGNDKKSWHVPS